MSDLFTFGGSKEASKSTPAALEASSERWPVRHAAEALAQQAYEQAHTAQLGGTAMIEVMTEEYRLDN